MKKKSDFDIGERPRTKKTSFSPAKMLFTLVVLGCSVCYGYANGQGKVSISMKDAPLEQVLQELGRKTGCHFAYSLNSLAKAGKVSIDMRDADLERVLNECLKGTGLGYRIDGDIVMISPAAQLPAAQPGKRVAVRGTVRAKDGAPLPGVSVLVKGTTRGVATDAAGNFSLNETISNPVTLQFSFIGYTPVERTIPASYKGEPLDVVLEQSATDVGEVVVTGIFNKARESYTGAATTITAQEIRRSGNRSILNTIRNIDPSFNIADNIEIGSDPNRLPDITIRGNASLTADVKDLQTQNQNNPNLPLFIMDGFEISLQRMMDLDDNQVETVTLLKDASATAMYGTRGANGVVVITTRQPEKGRLRVTYRGNLNIEAPDLTSYNLMDSREKLEFEVAAELYSGGQDLLNLYNQRLTDVERGVDTYWLKYPVRTGIGHKHSLRLEGGSDNLTFAASLGYNSIMGAMKGSERNTFNGGVFLSYRYKNITFQNDLMVSNNQAGNSPYGTFNDFAKINSYWKPYDDEGNVVKMLEDYYYQNEYMMQRNTVYNPLYNALLSSFDKSEYTQIQNNFAADWKILPELTFRVRLGITSQRNEADRFISPKDTQFDNYSEADFDRKGQYHYSSGKSFNYEGDISLNYGRVFGGKHSLYAGLSLNMAQDKMHSYRFRAEGFQDENANFLGMASQYLQDGKPTATENKARRMGGIVNVNYTYDSRYFADVSGKLEGSSKFGTNKRTAPFWSVGAGWNIHNEAFFKQARWLNIARLRLSYGISGAQSFSAYQALKTYSYFETNYHGWNGARLLAMGNDDLGWQETGQLNLGLDIEMWNGRLRLSADAYNKVTDMLLADITIPITSGFGSYKANVGKVTNKGVELGMTAYIVRNSDRQIYWSVGGTLAHNKNRIKQISNSLEFLNKKISEEAGANPSFLFKEGESINTIFAVRSLGIDPSNGKEVFIKADGTRTYTWAAADKVACGVAEPKIWGNLNTMFRYKGLTFNAVFGYRLGGQIYNQTLISKVENILPYDNADRRVLYDRWKAVGDHSFFKAVTDRSATRASSRFVMDERTFECRSLNLSYEWDSAWVKRLGVDYLTVSCYAEDLFRISTIKQERGLSYPFARKFSLSLTLRF